MVTYSKGDNMARDVFTAFKAKLREKGLTYKDVAEILGWSRGTFNCQMSGVNKWEAHQLYELMNLIEEPLYLIPHYFPAEDMGLALDVTSELEEEFEALREKEERLYELTEFIQNKLNEFKEVG